MAVVVSDNRIKSEQKNETSHKLVGVVGETASDGLFDNLKCEHVSRHSAFLHLTDEGQIRICKMSGENLSPMHKYLITPQKISTEKTKLPGNPHEARMRHIETQYRPNFRQKMFRYRFIRVPFVPHLRDVCGPPCWICLVGRAVFVDAKEILRSIPSHGGIDPIEESASQRAN